MAYLYIAVGGALGAVSRFLLSNITVKCDFPLMTFITNLLGALIIGFIVGVSEEKELGDNLVLGIKTGFCGAFTTFSTFSLETLNLLKDKQYAMGILYALLSLILCVVGVMIGNMIAKKVV